MTKQLKILKETEITEAANPMFLMGAQEQRKLDRQEAIKWIKHYRTLNEKNKSIAEDDRDVRGTKLGANYLIQEWIKHFFNLEEKDLK